MPVDTAGCKKLLEASAEKQLFGKTGRKAYYQQIDDESAHRRIAEQYAHGAETGIFEFARPATEAGQAFGQGDVIVPVYYVFLYGNRQKKHGYKQPDVFQPWRYSHFEQLGRFARYDKGCGNRRYYEREYILQNGAYAQCRRHISGQCAR